jgi:SAM-dependent methyltransferase
MLKINLGGGNFHHDGWTNVDYPFESRARKQRLDNIDIVHNFMEMKPLPIDSKSADIIYSEHCIEHLTDEAAKYLIKECYRILRPNAILRISCPDADLIYDRYSDENISTIGFNSKLFSSGKGTELLDVLASPLAGKHDNLWVVQKWAAFDKQSFFHVLTEAIPPVDVEYQKQNPGGHLAWWNFEKMRSAMTLAGFNSIIKVQRHESRNSFLVEKYIDNTKPEFSLRVEGMK